MSEDSFSSSTEEPEHPTVSFAITTSNLWTQFVSARATSVLT